MTSLLGEPRMHVALASGTAVRIGAGVTLKDAPLVPNDVGFASVGTTLEELKVELVAAGAEHGLD